LSYDRVWHGVEISSGSDSGSDSGSSSGSDSDSDSDSSSVLVQLVQVGSDISHSVSVTGVLSSFYMYTSGRQDGARRL
jgi:hypothetical protein